MLTANNKIDNKERDMIREIKSNGDTKQIIRQNKYGKIRETDRSDI